MCQAHDIPEYSDRKIKQYKKIVPDSDGTNLRSALDDGPVAIAFSASNAEFRGYVDGIYPSDPNCFGHDGKTELSHVVLAIGYGKYQGRDYILFKNSYGEDWGMKGYGWVDPTKCGVTQWAYQIVE